MTVRVGLDTNVLAYAEGTNGLAMKQAANDLIRKLPSDAIVLPVQALGELFNVLVLKAKRPAVDASTAILTWRDSYAVVDTSSDLMMSAADPAADHNFRIWDALMICVAAEAGCRLFLSEDLQDGFTWHGVTVTNPFAPRKHPILKALLGEAEGDDEAASGD